ncbi:MAG: shikimate kinase [Candidatus Acetothermia bacterium]
MASRGHNTNEARVFLIGFMASGKSTVAPLLAEELDCNWLDTDNLVEKLTDMKIPTIFRERGESVFRKYEREALHQAITRGYGVIALGGGLPMDDRNWTRIQNTGTSCYLQVEPETAVRRVGDAEHRPLLSDLTHSERIKKVQDLMSKRESRYLESDLLVTAEGKSPERLAQEIKTRLVNHENS